MSAETDGNNQESVSEAVNAWYAIYRLGVISGNKEYENQGLWLYNMELNAARNYWWNLRPDNGVFREEYLHNFASLVWGGKYEYNTFFSNRPEAKLGIIILPISAGSEYLVEPELAREAISKLDRTTGGSYAVFSDILNLYKMANGINPRIQMDRWLIDDGSSKSYNYVISKSWGK